MHAGGQETRSYTASGSAAGDGALVPLDGAVLLPGDVGDDGDGGGRQRAVPPFSTTWLAGRGLLGDGAKHEAAPGEPRGAVVVAKDDGEGIAIPCVDA